MPIRIARQTGGRRAASAPACPAGRAPATQHAPARPPAKPRTPTVTRKTRCDAPPPPAQLSAQKQLARRKPPRARSTVNIDADAPMPQPAAGGGDGARQLRRQNTLGGSASPRLGRATRSSSGTAASSGCAGNAPRGATGGGAGADAIAIDPLAQACGSSAPGPTGETGGKEEATVSSQTASAAADVLDDKYQQHDGEDTNAWVNRLMIESKRDPTLKNMIEQHSEGDEQHAFSGSSSPAKKDTLGGTESDDDSDRRYIVRYPGTVPLRHPGTARHPCDRALNRVHAASIIGVNKRESDEPEPDSVKRQRAADAEELFSVSKDVENKIWQYMTLQRSGSKCAPLSEMEMKLLVRGYRTMRGTATAQPSKDEYMAILSKGKSKEARALREDSGD